MMHPFPRILEQMLLLCFLNETIQFHKARGRGFSASHIFSHHFEAWSNTPTSPKSQICPRHVHSLRSLFSLYPSSGSASQPRAMSPSTTKPVTQLPVCCLPTVRRGTGHRALVALSVRPRLTLAKLLVAHGMMGHIFLASSLNLIPSSFGSMVYIRHVMFIRTRSACDCVALLIQVSSCRYSNMGLRHPRDRNLHHTLVHARWT